MNLNDLTQTWMNWLVTSALQAALVAFVALAVVRLLSRASAQFRYAILIIALVKFALPPFWIFPTGVLSNDLQIPETIVSTSLDFGDPSAAETQRSPHSSPAGGVSREASANAAVDRGTETESDVELQRNTTTGSRQVNGWLVVLLVTHLLGMGILGYRAGTGYLHVGKLIQNSAAAPVIIQQLADRLATQLSIRGAVRVRVSGQCDSPFAAGIFRPCIMLPTGIMDLPRHQLQVVLAHELVHISRRDLLFGRVELVLAVLWWFHPMMWWLRGELRRVREDCCDDILLARRLTRPEAYCETLISAAACRRLQIPEPLVLGFASGEHPVARRMRRLMDASLLRSAKLRWSALIGVIIVGLLVLPGVRPHVAPVSQTHLRGFFGGWKNLSFDPSSEEMLLLQECAEVCQKSRSTFTKGPDNKRGNRFDEQETRAQLEGILKREPDCFYAQHLLATWHRRNGDASQAKALFAKCFADAPVILSHRYQSGDGAPLRGLHVDHMEIECNRVRNGSRNEAVRLLFFDLVTDENGDVKVPAYDTVFRLASRSFPRGYSTEMPRLGFFEAKSRVGQIPGVTAWKSHSRPRNFSRSAAESAVLAEAECTTENEIRVGDQRFAIDYVVRAQPDGNFTVSRKGLNSGASASSGPGLSLTPMLKNAASVDHALIELVTPSADSFAVAEVTVLDSQTKIPLHDFQRVAGVVWKNPNVFHLYSLLNPLPETVDLVLDVHSYTDPFRMTIPVAESGEWTQDGVTFTTEYQGAGHHDGWSADTGYHGEAKAKSTSSEIRFRVTGPGRYSVWVVTTDGTSYDLKPDGWYSSGVGVSFANIAIPLEQIDHLEVRPWVESERVCFEAISLPKRLGPLDQTFPEITIPLSGSPEVVTVDDLEPLTVVCRTYRGNVLGGSFSIGRFGYTFVEQDDALMEPERFSTVELRSSGAGNLRLVPIAVDDEGHEFPVSGSGGSGRFGSATAGRVERVLKHLTHVKLQLVPAE